jgi:hypothetical protein
LSLADRFDGFLAGIELAILLDVVPVDDGIQRALVEAFRNTTLSPPALTRAESEMAIAAETAAATVDRATV